MIALNWVIIVQLMLLLGVIVVKEYFSWKGRRAILVGTNPGMVPIGTRGGDVDAHYWNRRFDVLERQSEKIVDAVNNCGTEMSKLTTIIKERLPRS